jgi:hypothetical protein
VRILSQREQYPWRTRVPIRIAAPSSQRTQVPNTLQTYVKGHDLLNQMAAPEGDTLDYGSGLSLSGRPVEEGGLGFHTFEPNPREGVDPTYRDSGDIPDEAYNRLMNLNVLNVVEPDERAAIAEELGRIITPGGHGLVTTRGRDVLDTLKTPGNRKGKEPMSVHLTDPKSGEQWYQKGFERPELIDYLQHVLGNGFHVQDARYTDAKGKKNTPLGPAGAVIIRK